MQCVLHDGKGGTCPLAEDLIITYTGKKTRRDGSLKRYVTYYITSHPELKWLTEIALVEYIGYDEDQGSSTNIRTDKNLIEKARRYLESGMKVNQIYRELDERLTKGQISKLQYQASYYVRKGARKVNAKLGYKITEDVGEKSENDDSNDPLFVLKTPVKQQKTKVKKFVKTKRLKRREIEENQIEDDKFEYDSNIEMIQPIVKIKRLKQTEINQIDEPKTKRKKVVKIKKLKRTEVDDNQIDVDDNQLEVDDNQIDVDDNQLEVDDNQLELDDNQIGVDDNQIEVDDSQVEDDDKFEYIITKRLKKVVKTKQLNQTEIDYNQLEESQVDDEKFEYDSIDENEMKQENRKTRRKKILKTKKQKQTDIDYNQMDKSQAENEHFEHDSIDENEMIKDEKKIKLFSSGRSKLVRAQILENNIENIEDQEDQLFLKCRTAEVHQRFLVHPTGTVIQN